ncbi:MAG TPA: hypothetical protein VFC10_04705 [Terriglobia bacterium]|nr:hypothetical protein [Terriglobia bacterium]
MRTQPWFSAFLLLCFSLPVLASASAQPEAYPQTCTVKPVDFHGWKAEQVANPWTTLTIVPQLGGRLMQASFGGHPYLFVNPQYYGKYFPPSQAVSPNRWFNYGGDKDWPLPEGVEDEEHWASARSDILDDGEYSLEVLSQGKDCAVQLTGPPDPRTGLQYSRVIGLGASSPRITFHAVMKNVTGHPIEWSIQSVSQYDTADPRNPSDYNHNFWAFTPVNPNSAYLEKYHVRSGPSDHPSFSVRDDNLFALHWAYLEAEVWLDSPAGWVAVVDGLSNYAMVERFKFRKGVEYPGKASVIFYVNGARLRLDSKGMPTLPPLNALDTPYYMEAELNSPMVHLEPEETYAFDTEWFPTRVGDNFKTVSHAGLVSNPLTASQTAEGLRLRGIFGVFYPGHLVVRLYDRDGMLIKDVDLMNVSPLELVTLDKTIETPSGVSWLSVHLEDAEGSDRGALGQVHVNPQERIQLK